MSHRREAGAIPPWVVIEPKKPSASQTVDPPADHHTESEKPQAGDHYSPIVTGRAQNLASGDHTHAIEIDPLQCLHITCGELVNSECTQRGEVLIVNGRFAAIGNKLDVPKGCPTLDASGLLIMPGGVDIASYIQNDVFGFDECAYENTMKEAVLGGTTTIIDTIICPKGRLPFDVFLETKNRVKNARLWCNVVYRIGLMEWSMPITEQAERLVKQNQVNSFLFFVQPAHVTGNSVGGIQLEQLRNALEKCRQWGVLAFVRIGSCSVSEKNSLESTKGHGEIETKSVEQVLSIAEDTNCPIVLTSPQQTSTIMAAFTARRHIPPVHVQVSCAPSTLLPVTENGKQYPSHFLNHLSTGDIVAVSSDQSGGNRPTGSARLGAIGQRLVAVWEAGVPTGWLDASSFVGVTSSNAARLAGLYPAKGRISQGSDADFVLWPVGSFTQSGAGRPIAVFVRGKLMAREGKLANDISDSGPYLTIDHTPMPDEEPQPQGTYVEVQSFPPAVYDPVRATDRLRRRHQYVTNRGPWATSAMSAELDAVDAGGEKPATGTERITSSTPVTVAVGAGASNSGGEINSLGVRMVHGHRDLQASGFSLDGAQVDDNQPVRSGIRTCQPPGGVSRNPLW